MTSLIVLYVFISSPPPSLSCRIPGPAHTQTPEEQTEARPQIQDALAEKFAGTRPEHTFGQDKMQGAGEHTSMNWT